MTSLMITGKLTSSNSSRDEKDRESGTTKGQTMRPHFFFQLSLKLNNNTNMTVEKASTDFHINVFQQSKILLAKIFFTWLT